MKERLETYPITYAILGLLASWGPLSGYDVKRLFDHMLSTMWAAAQSQIYKELRRMKEFGWVDMEREEQEARPDRKVYSITEQGHIDLRQWQAQPPEVFQIRDEMLLKVMFGSFAAPDDLAQRCQDHALVENQHAVGYLAAHDVDRVEETERSIDREGIGQGPQIGQRLARGER